MVDEGGELLVYPGGEASNCEINQAAFFMLAGKASDTLLAGGTMNNLGGEDSDTIVENGSYLIVWGQMVFSSTVPVRRKTCPLMWVVGLKCMPVRWKMR